MIVLREQGEQLAYVAHPSGQASATFLSTRVTSSELVFENPAHDFPQQIGYRLNGDALLGLDQRIAERKEPEGRISVQTREVQRRLTVEPNVRRFS